MSKPLIANEYLTIQKEISKLQKGWKEKLKLEEFTKDFQVKASNIEAPLIALTAVDIPAEDYLAIIDSLVKLLGAHKPEIKGQLDKVLDLLDTKLTKQWITEVLSFNSYYFTKQAEENLIDDWIPYYLAEQSIRPFLQVLAENYQLIIDKGEITTKGCPCCGEPVRLAQLEADGLKVLHCPRCHAHWQEKRLKCSHCGNEDHNTLKYLTVEGNSTEQIHICKLCNGYIKVIDTRQMIEKPDPTSLDIKTIYLDYVAQENGYTENKSSGLS